MQPTEAEADPAEWAEGELQPSTQPADSTGSTLAVRADQAAADTADSDEAAPGSSSNAGQMDAAGDAQSMQVDSASGQIQTSMPATAGVTVHCLCVTPVYYILGLNLDLCSAGCKSFSQRLPMQHLILYLSCVWLECEIKAMWSMLTTVHTTLQGQQLSLSASSKVSLGRIDAHCTCIQWLRLPVTGHKLAHHRENKRQWCSLWQKV